MKIDAYFRISTILIGVVVTGGRNVYKYRLQHKHTENITNLRNVHYIIPYGIINNNFRNLQEENVKLTITFILHLLPGDHGYFDTNN